MEFLQTPSIRDRSFDFSPVTHDATVAQEAVDVGGGEGGNSGNLEVRKRLGLFSDTKPVATNVHRVVCVLECALSAFFVRYTPMDVLGGRHGDAL